MINQPEERPLSIGSAVQFTHKGKTIHGHLLQRQGRRRFAKIVDTEERTWKVPESALKHSGGARRVTIITRHDKARAAYRVGDEVTFTSPDGPRRGSIVKLNPKSAQVRCGKTCWNVSYGLLRRAGRESARNGAERLNGVAGMARRLMDEQGLTGWTLAFGEARKRLGACHFPTPRDPDQPHPCPGGKRGANSGHRAARDRTRDRGTRGWPWTAVEGNSTANRGNTKSKDL